VEARGEDDVVANACGRDKATRLRREKCMDATMAQGADTNAALVSRCCQPLSAVRATARAMKRFFVSFHTIEVKNPVS